MPNAQEVGTCRLCGTVGPLTREHIPPASTYGRESPRALVQSGDDYLDGRSGRVYQSGFLDRVLCEGCNNRTGAWYGSEYGRFCEWGWELLAAMRDRSDRQVACHTGFPARIAKQVLATMVAASGAALTDRRPDIVDLVLDRERVADVGAVRLSLYLCPTSTGRSTGVAFAMAKGKPTHELVEIALRPFGWVLTLSGEPLDPRPVDISHFLTFGPDESVPLPIESLPALPTHEAFPGDYRTMDEIRLDTITNILREQEHVDAPVEARRIFAAGEGRAFLEGHGEEW